MLEFIKSNKKELLFVVLLIIILLIIAKTIKGVLKLILLVLITVVVYSNLSNIKINNIVPDEYTQILQNKLESNNELIKQIKSNDEVVKIIGNKDKKIVAFKIKDKLVDFNSIEKIQKTVKGDLILTINNKDVKIKDKEVIEVFNEIMNTK